MLSDLQKKKLTRFFNVWDANGDGVITMADPKQVFENLAKLQGLEPGSPGYEALQGGFMAYQNAFIQALDLDKDGSVSMEEWLAFHAKMLQDEGQFKGSVLMVIEAMFDLMDRNGDGVISLEEYGEWMKAFRIGEQDITDEVFKKLDRDGNGTLSKEEVIQMTREFFYSDDPEAPGNWALGPF